MEKLNLTDVELERLCVELVDSGFCQQVNATRRIIFSGHCDPDSPSYAEASAFLHHWLDDDYRACIFHLAESLNRNQNVRNARLIARVKNICYNASEPVFLTFTFTDECLSSTTEETRKKYVKRYLKRFGGQYLANIDFGAQNGREHYHALCSNRVPLDKWKHGALNAEKVTIPVRGKRDISSKKIGRYIGKLSNHAKKDTTGYKVIYSRRPPFRLSPSGSYVPSFVS